MFDETSNSSGSDNSEDWEIEPAKRAEDNEGEVCTLDCWYVVVWLGSWVKVDGLGK